MVKRLKGIDEKLVSKIPLIFLSENPLSEYPKILII